MSGLKGYDAWLERPYQEALAAGERAEAIEEAAENVADAAMCDPEVVLDLFAPNNRTHYGPLAAALSLLQRAAAAPAENVAELEDQAIAALHALRQHLWDLYFRSALRTMERAAAEEDRRAADDYAASLHEDE